ACSPATTACPAVRPPLSRRCAFDERGMLRRAGRTARRRWAFVGSHPPMHTATSSTANGRAKPAALALLASERPRNVGWKQAAGLLFGDWGTSRLYVLGLAFFFARGASFWLIAGMSLLILAVGWAYTQICRIYPDGGGVYTAAK